MLRSAWLTIAALLILIPAWSRAAEPAPIRTVEVRDRVFYVNEQAFFPIMAWLQDAQNFKALTDCGMNTTAGYWQGSSGTNDVTNFLPLVQQAGLYGVMPYQAGLKDQPALLGYIHGDEPDLPHQVSDAEVVPASELRVNRSTPLWKIVDGVPHTWSVLDPLEGASITIRLSQPVTVESLGVWLTISRGLAVAKDVEFFGDGQSLATATLENQKGRQSVKLNQPSTFRELKLTVLSVHASDNEWGSISEIEGFDAAGANVLFSPPRHEPRTRPEDVAASYREIKAADSTRPVFMTLTGHFHPHFQKWTDQQRTELYPAYIQSADVVGYDIYPIYGWNKPEWIHLVHDATEQLVSMAGTRPVYAWIETSKGGQYTGDLARQKDVTPVHIRAEVWMAICRGATAIGYFTHVWKPSYTQFGVPEENRVALREINNQITRLAPVILTGSLDPSVTVEASRGVKVDWMTRRYEGKLYVFVVNYDERATKTDIIVKGLDADGEVTVVDEDRQLTVGDRGLADKLDPLGVRVYCVN